MKRHETHEHISERAPSHIRAELNRSLLGRWISRGEMEIRQHEIAADAVRKDPRVNLNPRPEALTKPGDPRKLRGIPAIGGRGSLGGAMMGTRPGDGLK